VWQAKSQVFVKSSAIPFGFEEVKFMTELRAIKFDEFYKKSRLITKLELSRFD
jgi:hypothetical protein